MDVVVVGSCNIDFISYTNALPKPGETIHGNDFVMGFGGKGANQCVAAAKLGATTAIVSKVGDDTLGRNYCQNLKKLSIDVTNISCDSSKSTGAATILVDISGENCIVIVPGANLCLDEEDVKSAENLISNSKVLICQGEISEITTIKALEIGRKHKVLTVMNAAPAVASSDERIFKFADLFCINETEAHILTGISVLSYDDAVNASKMLIGKGCTNVIVTLGSKGAVFCNEKESFHVEGRTVESVVDTTGAGDSFIGALAYFISRSKDLCWKDLIAKSCKVAAVSVQGKGTQSSFPTLDEVPDL